MYRYAQINSEGYVVSDSYLSGEVIADNMIPLSEDFDLKNKRYVNGDWVVVEPEPEPLPTLSETDEAILNTNANVEYLVALKELEV